MEESTEHARKRKEASTGTTNQSKTNYTPLVLEVTGPRQVEALEEPPSANCSFKGRTISSASAVTLIRRTIEK